MLRRQRQIRRQFHQLMDACLFAFSFWLAYMLRSHPDMTELFGLDRIGPFKYHAWLYFILIPVAPLVLEAQGFYNRPMFCSRTTTTSILFKGCFFVTLGLILALFFSPKGLSANVAR